MGLRMKTKRAIKDRGRKKKNRRKGKGMLLVCLVGTALILGCVLLKMEDPITTDGPAGAWEDNRQNYVGTMDAGGQDIPEELWELLDKNPEASDFVKGYPDRAEYLEKEISLADDSEICDALSEGEVPLLMQWDMRWGYRSYGKEMIGLAGCGPVCLCMAYIYLTDDLTVDPSDVAQMAYEEGFYTEEYGTDWALWTQGAALLGLCGEELGLSENEIKSVLDEGGVVICSMRPGDFTTTGHFILLRGYDENGFYVNDPNRKSNSERQWSYDELYGQIKNLWGIQSGS